MVTAKDIEVILNIFDNFNEKSDAVVHEIMKTAHKIPKIKDLKNFEQYNCSIRHTSLAIKSIDSAFSSKKHLLSVLLNKLSLRVIAQ